MANDQDICVSVQGISKKFSRSLKRSFVYGARDIGRAIVGRDDDSTLRKSEFWAVQDVSLELRRGKSIGIIGLNGSGKTTLLRMICGIFQPTLGEIHINGRIAPMLALGAGFKPVLSGRENIFLNLSLLGVSQRNIRDRFDAIVDFADLWEAIDAPIGTYSSGMLARLGFACAVHTDPAILVVDEILSVGDARFRVKCRNRINEMRKAGTSMLLVSHSAILIETLSDECLYLHRGRVAAQGMPSEVLKAYEADTVKHAIAGNMANATASVARQPAIDAKQQPTDPGEHEYISVGEALKVSSVQFSMPGAGDIGYWLAGKSGQIEILLDCLRPFDGISINLLIFDLLHQPGETVQFMVSSRDIGWLRLDMGKPQLCLSLPAVGLRPGTYRVKLSISQGSMHDILEVVDDLKLVVRDVGLAANCLYFQPREWRISGGEVTTAPVLPDASCIEDVEEF